jgi:hypothetical protein
MFLLEYSFCTTFWEPYRVKTALADKNVMSYTQFFPFFSRRQKYSILLLGIFSEKAIHFC